MKKLLSLIVFIGLATTPLIAQSSDPIQSVRLVNLDTNQTVQELNQSQNTININQLPTNYTVIAEVDPSWQSSVGSLKFYFGTRQQVENNPPYALFAKSSGIPQSGSFEPGTFELKIEVYSLDRAEGSIQQTYTTNITVTQSDSDDCSNSDLNNDGIVNVFDFSMLASNFLKSGVSQGDINNDGIVNIFDFSILSQNFLKTCSFTASPTPTSTTTSNPTSTPTATPTSTPTSNPTPPPNVVDKDNDGMSDIWEQAHGLDNPNGDHDNDGRSNLQQYRDGLSLVEPTGEVQKAQNRVDAISLNEADYSQVIKSSNHNGGKITINGKNSVLIKDVSISGASGDGIRIENSENITIYSSEIQNSGQGIYLKNVKNIAIIDNKIHGMGNRGIQISQNGGSEYVTIAYNEIYDNNGDGMNSGEQDDNSVQHKNLLIFDNYFHDNAKTTTSTGLKHGIYTKADDVRVINNRIINSVDGNGLSIRTSGVVIGNTISGAGKSGIGYFPNSRKGDSNLLVIMNNTVSNTGRRKPRQDIDLLTVQSAWASSGWVVNNFIIGNNTIERKIEVFTSKEYERVKIY